MNYSANKMAAKHCLSAQCIVVDIVPLSLKNILNEIALLAILNEIVLINTEKIKFVVNVFMFSLAGRSLLIG
jgi:hypothetical protein